MYENGKNKIPKFWAKPTKSGKMQKARKISTKEKHNKNIYMCVQVVAPNTKLQSFFHMLKLTDSQQNNWEQRT